MAVGMGARSSSCVGYVRGGGRQVEGRLTVQFIMLVCFHDRWSASGPLRWAREY